MAKWYLPKDYKESKDTSPRYIVSEMQLYKLFCMKFSPLDFNTNFVKVFIKGEKLKKFTGG